MRGDVHYRDWAKRLELGWHWNWVLMKQEEVLILALLPSSVVLLSWTNNLTSQSLSCPSAK